MSTEITSEEVNEIIKISKADIIEYPIVYASVGEASLADQTESVPFLYDYDIVDGKVISEDKILKIGKSVEIKLVKGIGEESLVKLGRPDNSIMAKADENTVSYQLDTYRRELVGYDELNHTDGITVKTPYFSVCKINTQITQEIDSWTAISGLHDTRNGLTTYLCVCIRVLPPIL